MIIDDDDTLNTPPLIEPPPTSDPPPPYPSPSRRSRRATARRHHHALQTPQHGHGPTPSADSHSADTRASPQLLLMPVPFADDHDAGHDHDEGGEVNEPSPFLPPTPRSTARRLAGRPRSHSHTSTVSVAPSLAQTVLSLFRTEEESDLYDHFEGRLLLSPGVQGPDGSGREYGDEMLRARRSRGGGGFFSRAGWAGYFRPMGQRAYYRSLLHLVAINPWYALAAWIYLFVFTVAGTTLLMALPLGAILCFFNLLGARAFARGELALQTRFHSPLAYPAPYPPRPIFTRTREATSEEVEAGSASIGGLVCERSFYKNAYAMFTDPTSYQALFYFLVIKPSITLVFSLVLIVFVLPAMILVFPAPAALRAVRRLGAWQANVAVEGLYLAVR